MLTPLEVYNKDFKKGFRGYNEDEVDEFLDKVNKDYEKLYRDNIELKETIERVSSKLEHYQHMEDTLHSTLVIAQETAEEVKFNAKKEMELMTKEAQLRAEKMVDEAMSKVRRMSSEVEEMQRQYLVLRTRFRTMLHAQLEILGKTEEEEK